MKMKQLIRRRILPSLLTLLILCTAVLPAVSISVFAEVHTTVATTPTGYTETSDVVYKTFTQGKYSGVMNWGARGEDCTFLSPNAVAYYVGNYTYDVLGALKGGSQSTAPSSALYSALKKMMVAEHSHIITYDATRPLYAYTDCVANDSSKIISFYTGKMYDSTWNGGSIWNREHMWPRSKCVNQSKKDDSADIMMLRPESASANSSRGNKAYGESAAFYDPGESSRGDCARVILYGYTRWGNTSYMWGSSGVIENLDILLRWMEEDPVDTWEMGRNDAVESIIGVRNVFVDYPEYAWLLFNREIPDDMVTPSGIAAAGNTTPDQPDTTEPEFEMTQPEPPPTTEPEFEMTQPEPPPATEPEFEMTQPEPPPTTEPEFEMTQPEPPPTQPAPETDAEPETETDAESESLVASTSPETVPATTAPEDDSSGGGCSAMFAGGTTVVLLSLSALSLLLTLPKRRRKE